MTVKEWLYKAIVEGAVHPFSFTLVDPGEETAYQLVQLVDGWVWVEYRGKLVMRASDLSSVPVARAEGLRKFNAAVWAGARPLKYYLEEEE